MTAPREDSDDWVQPAAAAARAAARHLAQSSADQRNTALREAAAGLRAAAPALAAANAQDLARFQGPPAMRDRLTLTDARIAAMARSLEDIATLPDPLNRTLATWTRPNGLRFARVSAPIGVIGMIYESRPNVGAEAAGICLKAGSAILLRGGSDSVHSARAIHAAMTAGLRAADLPASCIAIAPDASRAHVHAMLAAAGRIDLIVPRGGKSLIEAVIAEARVPVLAHANGLCHTYIHTEADPAMARRVLANAKMRRPGICGATETLLIDAAIAENLLPLLVQDLATLGCVFRADPRACSILPHLPPAENFDTEWLDAILTIKVVDDWREAVAHIERHGSHHTDAIVTADATVAERFLAAVDSAVVMWNTSTQFCDGGEFGFGAEIGIATGRLHARGPVGVEQLTTYRTLVRGDGQVRA